jgi:hypothetical protein
MKQTSNLRKKNRGTNKSLHKSNKMIKRTKSVRNKKHTQKGRGLFNYFRKPVNNLKLMFQKAKTSETKLINNYEKLTKTVNDYYTAYNTHIANLIQLDTFLHNSNFETLFKTILIKEHFKKQDTIDRTIPLFLRNFVVGDDTSATGLRRELLIKQIRYKIHSTFPEREQALINDVNVKVTRDDEVIMMVKTIENKEYKRNIKHTDFLLNMPYLNRELKDIMKVVKENLKYESNIHRNNNSNYSLVNSNNIFKMSTSSRKKSSKNKSKNSGRNNNNSFFKNNMVQIVAENSGVKSNGSGESFNIFNLNKSKKSKNNQKFQNRRQYGQQNSPKFNLARNLGATGPEQQVAAPPAVPLEGFHPPGDFKPIKMTPQNKPPNTPNDNCEEIISLSDCRTKPSCMYDFSRSKCITRRN